MSFAVSKFLWSLSAFVAFTMASNVCFVTCKMPVKSQRAEHHFVTVIFKIFLICQEYISQQDLETVCLTNQSFIFVSVPGYISLDIFWIFISNSQCYVTSNTNYPSFGMLYIYET